MIRLKKFLLSEDWVQKWGWKLVGFFYLLHFLIILLFNVNVPFQDEWEFFSPGALSSSLNWDWVFLPHNEHPIVFTKLILWLFYKMNHLNFSTVIAFNWIIFSALLGFTFWIVQKSVPQKLRFELPLFALLLLAPISYDNQSWGMQNCFHLCLLFSVMGLYFAFLEKKLFLKYIGLSLCLFGMSFSLALGLPMAIVLFLGFSLELFLNKQTLKNEKWLYLIPLSMFFFILYFWSSNYINISVQEDLTQKVHSPSLSVLFKFEFWRYFLALVGWGFGLSEHNPIGVLPFFYFFYRAYKNFFKKNLAISKENWLWTIFGLMVFGALAAIALGRYQYGIEHATSSRYSEISMFLIPIFAALIWIGYSEQENKTVLLRKKVISFLFWFSFFGFIDNWDYGRYWSLHKKKQAGLECVKKISAQLSPPASASGSDLCDGVYPFPISEKLSNAKNLEINFTKNLLR